MIDIQANGLVKSFEVGQNILDGIKENNAFPVNEDLVETYKEWLKEHPFDNGGGGWAAEPWHQEEMEITEEIARRAAEKSEKAIFLNCR